ncbi:MAG: filamentous hemagglutinin N-terminal domain-containing protein [Gammaproteobacteria bacterium]
MAAGSASIVETSASRLDVNQHSDRAVIDWRSFDINANEHTSFQQPSSSSVALNRVQGSGSSLIDGRLTANGQIFLLNQNGVLFGKNARVDVAGLVATTADINNEDFMSGHYRFDKASANPDAQVVNQGQIHVQDGGAVVLAAPRVSNEGLIAARLGNVALAGTKTFTLDFHGDGLLQFDAGSEITEQPSDWQSASDAGTIVADGGIVAMSARGRRCG